MSRPALVIGLGGTGQWVLTWLKRDLLLSNNGELPPNVRLLAIDTVTQLEAGVRMVDGRKEESINLGDVRLGRGEFIYVGGDSRPIAEQVKAGNLPNISTWYHAERWLDMLPSATFILDDGAGRIRQFGRLSIFKDILGREAGSRIWRALRTAIESVRSQVDTQRRLEIIVVGSFAGGTGSGMFLDIALILRMLAQQMDVHHVLRGFFALPSVFTLAPDTEMKARTLAAWRELNRFMVINSDFPMPTIEYVERQPKFRISPDQRIFDACYLVDNKRGGNPIAAEAKFGAHPMVSEVISAILDDYAGSDYTQYVFTNLAPEYARTPDTPLYSAVGAYTIRVPAHYKQEVSAVAFASQMISTVLKPRDLDFTAEGARRHVQLAAPDQNQEVGIGFPGRSQSQSLLSTESVTYGGETAKPTQFTGRVAWLVEKSREDNQRAAIVNQIARAGGAEAKSGGVSRGWIGYFTDLGDDPQFEQLRKNVRADVNYNLMSQYGRRKDESKEEARSRFNKIPDDIRRRYGGMTATGEETYGSFGEHLAESREFHLLLFRRMVRLQLLDILMGHSDQDPIKAKSGKLGYAWDYFDGLVDIYEHFLSIMIDIKHRREEIKPEIKLQGLSENARRFMQQKQDAKFLWWELPIVKRSENAWLQAQQRLVDLRKEDLLHFYVVETAQEMKIVCMEVRDTIKRWIWHLATGDEASQIPGLWSELRVMRAELDTAHSFDKAIPAVQQMVSEHLPPIQDEDVEDSLSRLEWSADFDEATSHFLLAMEILPDTIEEDVRVLSDPSQTPTAEIRREMGNINQAHLMWLARQRFSGLADRANVAQELKQRYPTPGALASAVARGAEPLFDGTVTASARRKSNLIRVAADSTDSYFRGENGLEGVLRLEQDLNPAITDDIYRISVANSENPYKLTLVRTDDLYSFDDFSEWQDCIDAYAEHMEEEGQPQDPVLMHNFRAEAQAVVFERRLIRSGEEYKPLHPRVVMLLENVHALRQFLYLGMLGMLREREVRQTYRWELTWQKSHRGEQTFWLTRGWNADKDKSARPVRPDILNAMHGYIIRGKTWQPGRRDRIDYDFAERLIKGAQEKLEPQAEIDLIEDNLDENGFVGWLQEQAYDPDVPDRILRQDFADLATIARLMLGDRIAELEKRQESSTAGPFATITSSHAVYEASAAVDAGASQEAKDDEAEFEEDTGFVSSPFSSDS